MKIPTVNDCLSPTVKDMNLDVRSHQLANSESVHHSCLDKDICPGELRQFPVADTATEDL
ncbi:MAG: hypothetical protein AV945_gp06 [Phormidium phage MIS-PhV1B]|uniref:hypothetical protein n=1 Tax=Phormidium phage MIS-PhV1B TaxID=1391456 RepID=UPI0003C987FF|nr:MAG: hypothetical protein AV945_gp06 [Phormidium phage MIS-PhV1B]AGZ61813.1 MAG: hypothetical protein [Phormidium phage MIS-PhV1B]